MLVRIPRYTEKSSALAKAAPKDPIEQAFVERGFMLLTNPKTSLKVRKCLQTGIPALDAIAARDIHGVWGLPMGKQVEFAGSYDSAKTSTLIAIIAAAQKIGYKTGWEEFEHSLSRSRCENIGADIDKLWVDTPDHLELALENMQDVILKMPKVGEQNYNENKGLVMVLDSIASAPTKAEVDGKVTDSHIAEFARRMAQFQRMMNAAIGKRNVLIVYSNQLKDKIGVMFGKRKQTYGGNAIRFHCGLRFETVYTGKLKKGNEINGITINYESVKNKVWMPYKKIENQEFYFDGGFNYEQSLIMALESKGAIVKKGSKYEVFPLGKGEFYQRSELEKLLKSNHKLRDRLRETINAFI